MNKKKIIILSAIIVVLLVLLGVVLSIDSGNEKESISDSSAVHESEKMYTEKDKVYSCSMDSINNIRIVLESGSFGFYKKDGSWCCEQLSEKNVNSAMVSQLATRLSSVGYVEKFDSDVTAQSCGITETSPSVSFESDKGVITLCFADSFNDENLCYMSFSEDDSIYAVKSEVREILIRPLESYRNDSLKNINLENADDIVLVTDDSVISLKKAETDTSNAIYNEWRMNSPVKLIANDAAISESIIVPMNDIVIESYVSDSGDFAAYGLGKKDKYLKITEKSGKSQTLYYGDKVDGKYYVCINDSNSIYAVSEVHMPFVSLSAIDVADRHVKLVTKDSLAAIEVKTEDEQYNIKVSAKRDESSVNGNKLAETEFSSKVFSNICGLIADDIYTSDCGENEITVKFTYTDSGTDMVGYSSYNERYYAVSENGEAKFLILKSKLDTMLSALGEFK